ncbi:peroxisomal ATPase PEX6 isoform X2 [Euwallacea fornicatus]|uniref:peroxisomal ATPase PEX6 isoform X2 n=1 Tax=Euwallacea fornicatus TaxID=995702 RepID=UPI00338F8AB0
MVQKCLVFYILKIIYPQYHPIWFVIYMYFNYYSVRKRHTRYCARVLPENVLWRHVQQYSKSNCDINNCVLVNPNNLYPSDRILNLIHSESKTFHKIVAIPHSLCSNNTLYISPTLLFHLPEKSDLRLSKSASLPYIASEIHLAQLSSCDAITSRKEHMEGYFQLPKLIKAGDIICINVKNFIKPIFYSNFKNGSLEKFYYKCTKVLREDKSVIDQHFCILGQTTIKHVAGEQSFLPKISVVGTRAAESGSKAFGEVPVCPYGMQGYFNMLRAAIYPFLETNVLHLNPAFLLQGDQGCGFDNLISSLASELGMHHMRIYNSDLSANIYAQNESKLNNLIIDAKVTAPCILTLLQFENFGKNNEEQYDERLINFFALQLTKLFEKKEFPVILFCCSTSKNIPAELKRVFLEIFDIDAPSDTERELILKWLLEKNDIDFQHINLKTVANKTNGFYFEDLKALVYYAESNFHINKRDGAFCLNDQDMDKAIDHMQSNYNESLGAPKVPKIQWSDVGGLSDVKEEIIKTINLPLKHPKLFETSGLTRSGILLFGPPGTGKTLIAKAVATECGICFLSVKGPELLNMYVGQSEQNVREVFERAHQASPCIIFFDELDSLAPNRGLSGDSGGVMDRVVSQLLAEMDGLNHGGKVFIIGATNRPDLIDPALLRPGRFDKLQYVGPCIDLESKMSVLQALTRKFRLSEKVDLKKIVLKSPDNITGADFYGICSNAWCSAAKRLIETIEKDDQDFISAIENVKPSITEEDLKYFENLKEMNSNVRKSSKTVK